MVTPHVVCMGERKINVIYIYIYIFFLKFFYERNKRKSRKYAYYLANVSPFI
jgi:hypothetical protein